MIIPQLGLLITAYGFMMLFQPRPCFKSCITPFTAPRTTRLSAIRQTFPLIIIDTVYLIFDIPFTRCTTTTGRDPTFSSLFSYDVWSCSHVSELTSSEGIPFSAREVWNNNRKSELQSKYILAADISRCCQKGGNKQKKKNKETWQVTETDGAARLKEHVALDQTSCPIKSVCNRVL